MRKSAQTVIRPDAYYTIAAANGRVLEVADFNTENGASVRLWSYEGQPWQQWSFEESAEGEYRIKNRFTGKVKLRNVLADKVIDLVGMRVDNGTQAQIWQDVFGENQLWRLDPVPERLLNKETPAPKPKEEPRRTTRTQTEKKTSGKAARRTSKNK